jgi:hypothetical protein
MKKGTHGESRIHVSAPAEKVYDLVSDVTRMGEWSPECVRCEWIDGATGPAVGARFKGSNKNKFMRWSTKPRVIAAEPGREFSFVADLMVSARDTTKWSYQFDAASDGGTDVTESFEMVRDVPWYVSLGERAMGIKDRKADLEANMQQTLQRLKKAAEGSA